MIFSTKSNNPVVMGSNNSCSYYNQQHERCERYPSIVTPPQSNKGVVSEMPSTTSDDNDREQQQKQQLDVELRRLLSQFRSQNCQQQQQQQPSVSLTTLTNMSLIGRKRRLAPDCVPNVVAVVENDSDNDDDDESDISDESDYESVESPRKRRCSVVSLDDNVSLSAATTTNTKPKKCVQFNLFATTVHYLQRPKYRSPTATFKATTNKVSLDDLTKVFHDDDNESITSSRVLNDSTTSSSTTNEEEEHERVAMWYTRYELKQMKHEAKRFCRRLDIDSILSTTYALCKDPEQESYDDELLHKSHLFAIQRGLERWSSMEHCLERGFQLIMCKSDFFLEQTKQIQSGRIDAAKLASIYQQCSQPAVRFASLLGQADYKSAYNTTTSRAA